MRETVSSSGCSFSHIGLGTGNKISKRDQEEEVEEGGGKNAQNHSPDLKLV